MPALNVVAEFANPVEARDAMVVLERQGVDAGDITLVDRVEAISPGEVTRTTDLATGRAYAKRFGITALVGAVIGAVVFAIVVAIIGFDPLAPFVLGAAIAGAIVGFYLGGFVGIARVLPVNTEAMDTFGAQATGQPGPFRIAVYVPDAEQADSVVATLEKLHPRALHREDVEGRHLR